MTHTDLVRDQFNRQASEFDRWRTPKNEEYLKGFTEFLALAEGDTVLDVASGTGDFVVYAAPIVAYATGIDISDGMVAVSNEKKADRRLPNVEFRRGDVERLAFPDGKFDVVACKSAFHHMPRYERVFAEMVRCCRPGGRVGLCDIVAYDEPAVDDWFETFERLVDVSHARTLTRREYERLYSAHGISVSRTFELEIRHSIAEYLTHARQSDESLAALRELTGRARDIEGLAGYWSGLDGDWNTMTFRRKVLVILGNKP